eukprot:4971047-Amphidinium_carterae.1
MQRLIARGSLLEKTSKRPPRSGVLPLLEGLVFRNMGVAKVTSTYEVEKLHSRYPEPLRDSSADFINVDSGSECGTANFCWRTRIGCHKCSSAPCLAWVPLRKSPRQGKQEELPAARI